MVKDREAWRATVHGVAQGYIRVLLENLCGMSCSGTCWPLVVLSFSVDMKAFHELLSINVPWSQEFSGVLRV